MPSVGPYEIAPGAYSLDELAGKLDALVREQGCVLARGLPLDSSEQLNAFMRRAGYDLFEYDGIIVKLARRNGSKDVVSDGKRLSLHTECAFLPQPPSRIGFLCLQAAPRGGDTLYGSMRDFIAALPGWVPEIFAEAGGVRYHRWFPTPEQLATIACPFEAAKLSWQEWVATTSPDEAEKYFQTMGFSTRWDEGGGLHCERVAPAFVTDPQDGALLWQSFAQSPGLPPLFSMTLANGDAITQNMRDVIGQALEDATRSVRLDPGDFLLLDNARFFHGREAYNGARRILQVMANRLEPSLQNESAA